MTMGMQHFKLLFLRVPSTNLQLSQIRIFNYKLISIVVLVSIFTSCLTEVQQRSFNLEYNNGSSPGAFLQMTHSSPPTVRPPPYTISNYKCPSMNVRENWLDNLCGDLNTGFVPQNPFGHKFLDGGTYPFETIKNKTLEFFRRALPILKTDKSLPKVAKYIYHEFQPPALSRRTGRERHRIKRGIATRERSYPPSSHLLDTYYHDEFAYHDLPPRVASSRRRRQHGPPHNRFCDHAMHYYNRLCKIYNAMWGKAPHNIQREASSETRYFRSYPKNPHRMQLPGQGPALDGKHKSGKSVRNSKVEMPPTPCPSAAEYLTPVYARNHEGAWRYVVQIPREGYFTQTVEVTKCLKSNCFYMEGSCKTSPRWQSLLVAELFYPDTKFPTTPKPSYANDYNSKPLESNQLVSKNTYKAKTDPSQCDGFDSLGCFQVRLFYDWFLIPGSCKCWKNQFDFTRL